MALEGGLVRIHGTRLPDTQRFACARRAVKDLFDEDLDWVSFGSVASHFSFDHHFAHHRHRPRFTGIVVASVTVPRYQSAYLCLYPVPRAEYPDKAVDDFTASVLPQFRDWLTRILARPETEILGHEKIIAEWVDGGHRLYQVRSW